MATSGTYVFAMTIEDIIIDAFERAGIDESAINSQHRVSARRNLNLIFIKWQNAQVKEWIVEQRSVTLTDGDSTPTVDARMIDIIDMVLRRDSVDTPMAPISRKDYLEIPTKTTEGRPSQYWVDRAQGASVLTLWPVPENSTDIIVFNQIRRFQDVLDAGDTLSTENPDIHYLWNDALCAELGARMAFRFAPKRFGGCKTEAKDAYTLAKAESRERTDTSMTLSYG